MSGTPLMQRMMRVVVEVYQAIAPDAGEFMTDVEEAVEMCLDANRPETFGTDPEAVAALCALSFSERDEVATRALQGYFG